LLPGHQHGQPCARGRLGDTHRAENRRPGARTSGRTSSTWPLPPSRRLATGCPGRRRPGGRSGPTCGPHRTASGARN